MQTTPAASGCAGVRKRLSGKALWRICRRHSPGLGAMPGGDRIRYPFDDPTARYANGNVPPLLGSTKNSGQLQRGGSRSLADRRQDTESDFVAWFSQLETRMQALNDDMALIKKVLVAKWGENVEEKIS